MQTLGENFGKTLVKLREERNLTAKELASLTKKSPSYISKLETGNVKKPRKETLKEILSCLDLDEDKIDEIINHSNGVIKKSDKSLYVKNGKSESNSNFIEKSDLQKTPEISQFQQPQKLEDEEIIFQFSNRYELGMELNIIAQELKELGRVLINRKLIDIRYDTVKHGVNRIIDRLEIYKVNYQHYIKKLINESNNYGK